MERSDNRIDQKDVTDIGGGSGTGNRVLLQNCNCHSFNEVETALSRAGIPNGKRLAVFIHNKGSAVVYTGELRRCEEIVLILESYGLVAKIQ